MSYRPLSACRAERNCCLLKDGAVGDRGVWWSQTGSNRRPHACKARALPTELWPQSANASGRRAARGRPVRFASLEMVGLGGLEPPTSRLSSARSNQLSYKPELAALASPRSDDFGSSFMEERETKAAASRKDGLTGRLIPRIPAETPRGPLVEEYP
jgi:hypothetical protein